MYVKTKVRSVFLQNIFMESEMRYDGNNENKTKKTLLID